MWLGWGVNFPIAKAELLRNEQAALLLRFALLRRRPERLLPGIIFSPPPPARVFEPPLRQRWIGAAQAECPKVSSNLQDNKDAGTLASDDFISRPTPFLNRFRTGTL